MSTAKKEEIARLMVAWRKAKEDVDGAKAYAGWHPVSTLVQLSLSTNLECIKVCSICSKSKDVVCVRSSDGIRCSRCKEKKVGCPRLVDFWIFHIARQLKRSETYVRNLYNIHCRPTRRYRGRSGSERTAGGSSSRGAVVGIEEDEDDDADIYTDWDEDQTSMDDEEKMDVLPRIKKPKMKATVQNSTSASTNIWRTPNNRGAADWRAGVTHNDSKSELAILKKENECKAWFLPKSPDAYSDKSDTSVEASCRNCRRQFCRTRRSCPRFPNITAI